MKAQKLIREGEKSTNTTMKENIRTLIQITKEHIEITKEQSQGIKDLMAMLAPSKLPAHRIRGA